MFERYTEKARLAVFFARYEASEFGCDQIEADFLLLGIARVDTSVSVRWLGANYTELRATIEQLYKRERSIPTSDDLPLSGEASRALTHAAEEAERMAHRNIGSEHILLGLFREPECAAAKLLAARGGDVATVRATISLEARRSETAGANSVSTTSSPSGIQLRLVGEDGGEITSVLWPYRVPNVDEAISLPGVRDERVYRVDNVHWRLTREEGSGLRAREVVLKVRSAKVSF